VLVSGTIIAQVQENSCPELLTSVLWPKTDAGLSQLPGLNACVQSCTESSALACHHYLVGAAKRGTFLKSTLAT
jgi:hypothetical protein